MAGQVIPARLGEALGGPSEGLERLMKQTRTSRLTIASVLAAAALAGRLGRRGPRGSRHPTRGVRPGTGGDRDDLLRYVPVQSLRGGGCRPCPVRPGLPERRRPRRGGGPVPEVPGIRRHGLDPDGHHATVELRLHPLWGDRSHLLGGCQPPGDAVRMALRVAQRDLPDQLGRASLRPRSSRRPAGRRQRSTRTASPEPTACSCGPTTGMWTPSRRTT